MTWNEVIEKFLDKVHEIVDSNPAYKQPGDGSGGVCDCIGLVIGAIRRMGLKWTGIHGSNWAARKEFKELKKVNSYKELELGDVVLKAYEQGDKGWNLPKRYQKDGAYYNEDLKDYYHAGVVTSVNPLRITHMTSPHAKVDTSLGKWKYHGQLSILVKVAGGTVPVKPVEPDPIPTSGAKAIVVSDNGYPVKMRQYPSTSCRTWEKIPVGTEVEITDPGEEWAQINCGRRKGWYMMAKFLDVVGDGKGQY